MKGLIGQKKPSLLLQKDGYPSGQTSPEGATCDLARAFIQRKVTLFKSTCIKPIGDGESAKEYGAFLKQMANSFATEAKKKTPSPGGPKAIVQVFAARPLSKNGPASYAYAVLGLKDVKFVDVSVLLHNGKSAMNRTLVVQEASGKWFVHPLPTSSPLLSDGLNEESPSTIDISAAYNLKPAGTRFNSEQAVQLAQKAAGQKVRTLSAYEEPKGASYRDGTWIILFNAKVSRAPGDHFFVEVNDKTGKAQLIGGM